MLNSLPQSLLLKVQPQWHASYIDVDDPFQDPFKVICSKEIPSTLCKLSRVWLLLLVVTLWTLCIERNDLIFSNTKWDDPKKNKKQKIWQSILDYAIIAWDSTCKKLIKGRTMRTRLGSLTGFGAGMRFSIIEITREPCIGTQEHLM